MARDNASGKRFVSEANALASQIEAARVLGRCFDRQQERLVGARKAVIVANLSMYRQLFILVLAWAILAACGPTLYTRPPEMTMEEAQRHLDECQEEAYRVWAAGSARDRCMASRGFVKQ